MQILTIIWIWALTSIFIAEPAEAVSPLSSTVSNSDNVKMENSMTHPRSDKVNLSFRLPNDTYPEHYHIKLTTNVHNGKKNFRGEVIIDIVVVNATSSIVLHARRIKILNVTITNRSTGASEKLLSKYELKTELLKLTREKDEKFAAQTKWKLTIIYSGKLRNDNQGFYLSKYIDDEGHYRYLATTYFESTNARHAFPCYDEPDKRANFTITINHSPNYTAISNMPVNELLSSAGKTVFLTTARIPTYIVAFIVSDFEYTVDVTNGLTHRVYSRHNAKNEQEYALSTSMLITKCLSENFPTKFMLPKISHVAIPDFEMGAMENWGLATYSEDYLLYNKNTSTIFRQAIIAISLAHELCHHWFGNYVGIKWWSYLWLKEGLATLCSYGVTDDIYPEWNVWQEFHVVQYQTALTNDGSNSPRAMTHYVQNPYEISRLYDSVSYSKAGSVLNMWSNALTSNVFKQGVHNYLMKNKYSAAVEEQLFTAIQNAVKEENYKIPATISEMMSSWTQQGGYPILTVTRNYDDGSFTVKQEAFYNDKTLKDNKTWYVPINYVVASNPDFRQTEATHYLLNVSEIKVDTKVARKDWLMLNKQSTYYYRIKYDLENYKLITECLIQHPFNIHTLNRAQLMHDVFCLSESNRLDDAILLKMLTYLKKEDQFATWSTANDIIISYNRYLSSDDKYEDFKFFIADHIVPIYKKLGLHDIPGELRNQKYTRSLVINLACLAGVRDCLEETNNRLKAVVKENTPIEPNLQTPIYCNGLKQSGEEEFNFVYNKLMESADKALNRLLITALGCAQNKSHIEKFIYSSIDQSNNLSIEDRFSLLKSVYSRGEMGLLACIDFLNKLWNNYVNLDVALSRSSKNLHDHIRSMASYVVNKNQEEKLLALVAQVNNTLFVKADLETSVKKSITNNFQWLKDNRESLMSWFAEYRATARMPYYKNF